MIGLFGGVYNKRTVLVTGHTGFKGSWLAYWLSRMGANVIGYSLEPPSDPNHFSLLDFGCRSIIGDILDRKLLRDVMKQYKPEIVFHLAAQPLVRLSYEQPIETFFTNVIGTLNVLEESRLSESVKAFVSITSDKVYENREWAWGYRESDHLGGYDPYSASKGCAEIAVASYRRSFLNCTNYGKSHHTLVASVRAGNVIGGGDWAADRLIPDIMKSCSKGETVMIRSPHAIRPWQHVLECLSGYLAVGQKLLAGAVDCADGWNFGPTEDGALRVEEVVKKVKQYWPQVNYAIQSDNKNPHEATYLKLDCSKARHYLSWRPVWDVDTAFDKTVSWYRAYYTEKLILTADDLDRYVNDASAGGIVWTK